MDKKLNKQQQDEQLKRQEYPSGQDIYNKNTPEPLDQEGDEENKVRKGADLDVPGSELDDENEKIGEEDEENNYYSLGGDEHNDLDETPE